MDHAEFLALHDKCITDLQTYLTEARKTSRMLGECTPEPLSFRKRFALLCQEIVEKDAHVMYLQAKRLLHSAALLGYAVPPSDSSRAATLSVLQG